MGQNKGHSGSLGFTGTLTPASLPHSVNGRSNTLPMRSSAAASLPASVNVSAHQNSQQLPSTKHVNPCQSVKTLPFGFGSAAGGAKQQQANRLPKDMQDLIHLAGPLNEHAVMHTLQARFNEQRYFVSTP